MTHPSGYGEAEKVFRASEYGATLAEKARYDKYRHPSLSVEDWVKLLGRDVSNLEHLSLTRGIALAFVRHSKVHQPDLLDAEDELVLPLTGSLHDWGEAITGDISFGDKTKAHDEEETQALDMVAASLYSDEYPPLVEEAKAIVFDHEGTTKRGKLFFAIECIGYMRTALTAMDHVINQTAPEEQVPGLKWLYTDVMSNVPLKMIAQAEHYDAVKALLIQNIARIDQAFAQIGTHGDVFENYGVKKMIKVDEYVKSFEAWLEFKENLGVEISV